MNPYGQIFLLVDRSRGNLMHSSHLPFSYILRHYDRDRKFWPDAEKDPNDYSQMLQWLFFGENLTNLCQTLEPTVMTKPND